MNNKNDPNLGESQLNRENAQLKRLLLSALATIAEQEKLGRVFHDFNNILSSLMGYSSLASERVKPFEDDKLERYLGNIERSGIRARDLVKERLELRQQNRVRHLCTLNDVITDTMPSADTSSLSQQFFVHIEKDTLSFLFSYLLGRTGALAENLKVNARPVDAAGCKACAAEFSSRQLECTIDAPQIRKSDIGDIGLAEAILSANGGHLCHSLVQDGQIVIYLRSATDKVHENF